LLSLEKSHLPGGGKTQIDRWDPAHIQYLVPGSKFQLEVSRVEISDHSLCIVKITLTIKGTARHTITSHPLVGVYFNDHPLHHVSSLTM
jgi:hypothetical protein